MGTIIFDFDGTIADTFFIAADVFRKLAKGRHPTHDAEIEILRSLPTIEAVRRVGVKWWQLPYVVFYGKREVKRRRDEVKPIAGMAEALQQLHARGYKLFIATSNSSKNVERFLQSHNLSDCFAGVYGGIGIFAKASALRKIAAEQGLPTANCYYVGDETRDIDAARRARMPSVSVSWGYNNAKGLERGNPEQVVHTPKELLKLFPPQPTSGKPAE